MNLSTLYERLSSIRLTIFLCILLVIVSVLGKLLELGSEGDVVSDCMVDLRCLPPCPYREGMVGEACVLALHFRVCSHVVLLLRGQSASFRSAQLCHG